MPFAGDLNRADIFILALNPGFQFSNYWAEYKSYQYRECIERTLRQDFENVEFPFLSLDPALCWYSGFMYWEKKLRDVLLIIAETQFSGSYFDAMRSLAKRLAVIELIAYRSQSFAAHKLIKQLPSTAIARNHVKSNLLPRAIRGEIAIIVTRQVASWGIEEDGVGSGCLCVYKGAQTHGSSLSSRSEGGRAILRRYGIAITNAAEVVVNQ
jgi:hypothetical protein